jgi:hypothetical protein
MNAGEFVTAIVLFGTFLAAGIIAMVPIYKRNKDVYNPINRAFMVLLWFVLAIYTSRTVLYLISELYPNTLTSVISVGLKPFYFNIDQAAYLTFLFYILGLKRFYTLPGVVIFFVIYYLVINPVENYMYASLPLLVINVALFMKKGIDNHNGTIFGYSLFMLVASLFGSVYAITSGDIELIQPYYLIGFTMGFLLLSLGTYGWYERHVLYDWTKERKIKNGWAAQRIQVTKQLVKMEAADKKVFIECPVCHMTNVEVFSLQKVESRYKDARGITIETISKASNCGHAFRLYVDRNFKVRAAEPFETSDLSPVSVVMQ